MESDLCYNKAIDLLKKVSTTDGFLASSENLSNYNRVWARDGVICGLAALASADESLINGFKNTLQTLAKNQHKNGTIPSNVSIIIDKYDVSYGGLAGRVDAVNWFLIGICQYAYHQNEPSFVSQYLPHINKCLSLLEAWEFNNKHLLYVPLSGNWADEYITDGYVLYDQLLRVWALRCLKYYIKDDYITQKEEQVTSQININYTPNNAGEKYHQNAYNKLVFDKFMPCSFSPAGYKTEFDAFATSLALMLNIGDTDFQQQSLNYAFNLSKSTALK
ncbi:MAG: fructofuranosidase/invertase, partial [Pedobacter sp.]